MGEVSEEMKELLIGSESSPFCQIAGSDISVRACLETQGQPKCFGCAATTRLCEECKQEVVAVPAVGLGSICLTTQLERDHEEKPECPTGIQVNCQLLKKKIRAEMCVATQGQAGCKGCAVPSRLCEKCHISPCRFPQYGFCLTCTVAEYGDGWEPIDLSTLPKDEIEGKGKESHTVQLVAHLRTASGLKASKIAKILSNEEAGCTFIKEQLKVNTETARKYYGQLKNEGFVSVPAQTVLEQKISKLEELIKIIGEESSFGKLLRSLIGDLEELQTLRKKSKKTS